jgi:hypothetical protein
MTIAAKAFGTKLYKGGSTANPSTGGTAIEKVFSMTMPSQEYAEIDVTSHDSAAAEYIAGLLNNGTVEAQLHYTGETGQAALRAALGGDAAPYYINYAGGSGKPQLYFNAIPMAWKWGEAGKDNAIDATVTLRISGAVTVNTQ